MKKKKSLLLPLTLATIPTAVLLYMRKRQKEQAVVDALDGTGQTVLITGATNGIGKELAFLFARHHFNIVAVARNEDKLFELKMELENSHNIDVMTIAKDLSNPDAAKAIYDEVHAAGIEISQLVNNAGAGKSGTLIETEPETLNDLITLNVTSVTMLCRWFGQDMAKKRNGRILITSSIVAFLPDPYCNVYGPSKAYDLRLAETLYGELHDQGVEVCVLCPGPVKTGWSKNAGRSDSAFAGNVEEVAKACFDGMQSGRLVILPDSNAVFLHHVMPHLPAKVQALLCAKWEKGLLDRKNAAELSAE